MNKLRSIFFALIISIVSLPVLAGTDIRALIIVSSNKYDSVLSGL